MSLFRKIYYFICCARPPRDSDDWDQGMEDSLLRRLQRVMV